MHYLLMFIILMFTLRVHVKSDCLEVPKLFCIQVSVRLINIFFLIEDIKVGALPSITTVWYVWSLNLQ